MKNLALFAHKIVNYQYFTLNQFYSKEIFDMYIYFEFFEF